MKRALMTSACVFAALALVAAPAAANDNDLSSTIDVPDTNPGESLTITVGYANAGPDPAVSAYINTFFPMGVPKPFDQMTPADFDAIQASAAGTDTNGNNPYLFIEDNYCYHYLFQLQGGDGTVAVPILPLPAGGSGSFSFDLAIPMDEPTLPMMSITEPANLAENFIPYGMTLDSLLNAAATNRFAMGADCVASCDPLTDCFGARLWELPATDADFALADDGVGDYTSCSAITTDVAGKVALIRRGGCEFGQKAYNAEQAGALMAVIVNNGACGDFPASDDCVLNMSGGALGALVTIPVIQISTTDGEALITAAESGTVRGVVGAVPSGEYWADSYSFVSGTLDTDPDDTNDEDFDMGDLGFPFFADGFESGDTSGWDGAVP